MGGAPSTGALHPRGLSPVRPCGRGFLVGAALLGTISCQGSGGPEQQYIIGLATFGHEVRSFRACGSEEDLWAIDSTGVLWDLHQELAPSEAPYEEVFAAVFGVVGPPPNEGFGADYEGSLVVKEVLYVAGEGLGCGSDWSEFSYRASGNEPFWNLEITPQVLELDQLGLGRRSWTLTHEEHEADGVHFTGRAPDGTMVEASFSRKPCRDSMAGAYFGFSVAVQIDGEKLLGCGLRGAYPG